MARAISDPHLSQRRSPQVGFAPLTADLRGWSRIRILVREGTRKKRIRHRALDARTKTFELWFSQCLRASVVKIGFPIPAMTARCRRSGDSLTPIPCGLYSL